MAFKESFTFNPGELGRNLDTIDAKIHRFIKTDLDVAASRGEVEMKAKAPWKDRTAAARAGLWAEAEGRDDFYQLAMGHTAEYGIYLEKMEGGRFQIIMPVLVATARAFMESLTDMFQQLDNPAPILPAITPGIGFEQGTSQGAIEHGQHVRGAIEKAIKKPRVYFRSEGGRFVAHKGVTIGTGRTTNTSKTRRTRRK
jgi:hypothetical protein